MTPAQSPLRHARLTHQDAGIFLISFAVLLTELLLTRIFSVTMFYHLSFLVVSLAMLGFGASGLLVSLWPERFPEEKLPAQAAAAALGFALSSVAAVGVAFQLPITLDASAANWLRIGATYLVCAVPFLFGGLVVSLLLTHRARVANRLYFFDLLGAALACVAFIPATDRLGAPTAILVAAAVAALASAVLGAARGRGVVVAALLLAAAVANGRLHLYDVRFIKGAAQPPTLALRWNSFSRVDVVGTPRGLWQGHTPEFPGYSSRLQLGPTVPEASLRYDGDAATQITYFDGDLRRAAHLAFDVSSSAYQMRRYGSVLIIGPGGGRDVLTALLMGSGPITGVEINPITVQLMRTRFRTFSGGLYDGYPGVTVLHGEGRSFLRSDPHRYQLIEASLVDTWAATAAGAYALTENSLYTVEAFEDYLDHLTDDGVICFNRWFNQPPVESLRVVSLAREALARRGVSDPAAHVMVIRTDPEETLQGALGSILVKKTPFTAAEIEALRRFASDMGFVLVYAPGLGGEREFQALLGAGGAAFIASYPYDVSPVHDDRPFFFSRVPLVAWAANRLGLSSAPLGRAPLGLGGQTLLIALAATTVATVLLLGLPLWAGRSRDPAERRDARRSLLWALYFGGVGLGFILVEIVLIQRFGLFLGYPVYSLSVVLFTMLLATGVGSLAFGGRPGRSALSRALAGLAVVLALYAFALPRLLAAAQGWSLGARMAVAVAVIAPLGLLMGIPFSTGVGRAGAESKPLVAWGWAVNGGASVFGSTLAVVISMSRGFTATFVAGLLAYALALLAARRLEVAR